MSNSGDRRGDSRTSWRAAVGVLALLAVDVGALLLSPTPATAAAVVVLTGSVVLATQLRELLR